FITEVFFLLATPESLAGNYRAVSENLDGSVFNMDNEHPVSRYEADSQISTSTARLQSTSDLFPGHVSSEYLRLPELDSRIKPLTDQIVGIAKTPYDRASTIETYLRTHYGYTLQLANAKPADPISDF